jgi:hypothetical protein
VDVFYKNNSITSKLLNEELEKSQKDFLFKISFIGIKDKNEKYTKIKKKMFENLKIRSFSLTGLGIKEIETNSFESKLETLNLSSNSLKRVDFKILKNLNNLIKIDLSNNQIQLKENNFEFNKNLRFIDISHNDLHYLPMNLFHNVNELEFINLNNNHLELFDACILSSIQDNIVFQQFRPALIMLENNPIHCDCDMFYLNRYANFRLNLTCSSPLAYFNRTFNSLKLEDPKSRCNYKRMAKICAISSRKVVQLAYFYSLFERYLVLGCAIIIISLMGCCVSHVIKSINIKKLNNNLKNLNKNKISIKNSIFNNNANKLDTQNLIESSTM